MNFPNVNMQQKLASFVSTNASGLLTAGGVIGVGVTAVLTGRATVKAHAIVRERTAIARVNAEMESEENGGLILVPDWSKKEIVAMTWQFYIPPAVVGIATISSIIMANRMSAKRAAALAAAYGISETRLQEYKEKVAEKFGVNKERAVRDEIAQDRVNNNPPSKEVIIMGNGDVLCYDSISGRYFHSTVEQIKQAESTINGELFNHQYASLSQFYDEIGLTPTALSEEIGWNTMVMEPVEIKFSTTMTPDNRPCLVLDYSSLPYPDYHKLY
jgi:Family of unknown function (DUF6353)